MRGICDAGFSDSLSGLPWRSVQPTSAPSPRSLSHMCAPPCKLPSHMPHLRPGLTLRTLYRSSYTHDLRHASSRSASLSCARPAASAANADSAASMPVFIALWLPLMRGRLTKPAEQPISAPPGNAELRHRLQSAFVDRARAVAEPLAALERRADGRMRLEALELVVRRQVRVLVVEMDDEADATRGARRSGTGTSRRRCRVERPALAVEHEPLLVLVRRDLPQFLDADAVLLRIDAVAQVVLLHELLRQRAAAAFGEQRVLGVQLHARLVVGLVRRRRARRPCRRSPPRAPRPCRRRGSRPPGIPA